MVALPAACGNCVVSVAVSIVAAAQRENETSKRVPAFICTDPPECRESEWRVCDTSGASAVPRLSDSVRRCVGVANFCTWCQLGVLERAGPFWTDEQGLRIHAEQRSPYGGPPTCDQVINSYESRC